MKETVMSKILGWFFDRVMHKPLQTFEEAVNLPFASQEAALRTILLNNGRTEFGAKHTFSSMTGLSGTELWKVFRNIVPIQSYADYMPQVERMKSGAENILIPGKPEMFSLTSGTTSEPKFCPINRTFIKEHHRQHLLWMYHVYADHPRVNQGKYLVMASPAEMGRTTGGIPYGAMSGKQLDVQSIPVRRRMAAPAQIQHLEDAEERWFYTLLFAMTEENLRVVTSVNPSTLVALANRMDRQADWLLECMEKGIPPQQDKSGSATARALAGMYKPNPERARKLREMWKAEGGLTPGLVWPELEMLLTWQGGASSFYLPHVATLWGNTAMRCLGLRASEGTFSIPLRDGDPSGVLAIGGHVMEFIPADAGEPKPNSSTLLAGQLEKGGLYRLIITTSGGFYRYDMGDLVRVTGFNKRTPEVAFERRAGSVLSATGEKLTEDQVIGAMEVAAAPGPLMNGFSVTYEMEDGVARYVVAVECTGGNALIETQGKRLRERMKQLLAVFDHELRSRNCEYEGKREDGRIAFPRAVLLAEGSYETLRAMLAAEGKPENQVKQPILIRPPGTGKAPVAGCSFFDKMTITAEL